MMPASRWALPTLFLISSCRCGAPFDSDEPRHAVDFHTHVGYGVSQAASEIFLAAGVDVVVNLVGRPFESSRYRGMRPTFEDSLKEARRVSQKIDGFEYLLFSGVDWYRIDDPDFGELAAEDLRRAVAAGARGLKISKALGLGLLSDDQKLMPVDDPRFDPLWKTAGELGVPVAIHTGDPLAFFQPVNDENPRIEELRAHPSWSFHGDPYPSLTELLAARDRLVARHPETLFVAVHVGGFPEDLEAVSASMRKLPNLWIDVAARLPEIGRQAPARVRSFFEEFQDRILLGTDLQLSARGGIVLGSGGPEDNPTINDAVAYYQLHWKFFETEEREIKHMTPIQGRWTIDAIGLPRELLEKLYRGNAVRLLKLD